MTTRQQNKLSMLLLVTDNLSKTPQTTLQSMPGFNQMRTELNQTITEIRHNSENQLANRTGYSITKTNLKAQMVIIAANLADCLQAFADSTNNTVLKQEMKITKTKLTRLRAATAADVTKFIIDTATQNLAAAAPFGVTQTIINQLTQITNDFNQNITLPQANIQKRKVITKTIASLFEHTNQLIQRMDTLVNILQLTNPDFYQKYYYTRKTVHTNASKLAVRGTITDQNSQPIAEVTIAIPKLKRTTHTTPKGYFEFKNLPAGLHTLTLKRPGYETLTQQIGSVKSQRLQLNLTLNQIPQNQNVA